MKAKQEHRRLQWLGLAAGAVGAGLASLPSDAALAGISAALDEGFLSGFVILLYNGFLCF